MNQSSFQKAWGYSMPLYHQQNHPVTHHGDDPEPHSECQFPDDQRNLLSWPDFGSIQPSFVLVSYSNINHESFIAQAVLPKNRPGDPFQFPTSVWTMYKVLDY